MMGWLGPHEFFLAWPATSWLAVELKKWHRLARLGSAVGG